ncbi:MAG TPA: MarR family transcriptional regulator, partial [Blastocatellia bacterium]
VQSKEGNDRRVRIFRLTRAGRQKFQKSLPHWKRAQEHLQTALSERTISQLSGLLAEVTLVSV